MGLMQLIPSTARQTARKFKIPYRHFRELYNPSKNISLGTAHFRELLDKYDNSFILSVAAYNAGRTPTDKWNNNKNPDTESLDFIENIPYQETRSYIKLIIRNYIFYHNMLDGDNEPWFPEWVLQ